MNQTRQAAIGALCQNYVYELVRSALNPIGDMERILGRVALRSARPMPVLLLSSVLRIAALLSIGWLVAQSGPVALTGFVLTFVAVRFGAITIARRPAETEVS